MLKEKDKLLTFLKERSITFIFAQNECYIKFGHTFQLSSEQLVFPPHTSSVNNTRQAMYV